MNTFTAFYKFHFGSVDCIAFGTLCSAHNVGAFPTFVLYKDGEEVKRFTGAKQIKPISDFVEDVLETIRPGSRPAGGPELPEPGDKNTKNFQAPAAAPVTGSDATSEKDEKSSKATTSASKEAAPAKTRGALKATPVKTKPKKTKATSNPNPLGKSISFTAETFQNSVTMTQDPWFIKFYAPWCHHCQAMAPNWVQLAKEFKGKLNIGEVNCDIESRLCKDAHLRGYPTILFFQGGERV
jgi:protein disulfide-isomerase